MHIQGLSNDHILIQLEKGQHGKDELEQYYLRSDGICLEFQRLGGGKIFPNRLWICGSSTRPPVLLNSMYNTVIHN